MGRFVGAVMGCAVGADMGRVVGVDIVRAVDDSTCKATREWRWLRSAVLQPASGPQHRDVDVAEPVPAEARHYVIEAGCSRAVSASGVIDPEPWSKTGGVFVPAEEVDDVAGALLGGDFEADELLVLQLAFHDGLAGEVELELHVPTRRGPGGEEEDLVTDRLHEHVLERELRDAAVVEVGYPVVVRPPKTLEAGRRGVAVVEILRDEERGRLGETQQGGVERVLPPAAGVGEHALGEGGAAGGEVGPADTIELEGKHAVELGIL